METSPGLTTEVTSWMLDIHSLNTARCTVVPRICDICCRSAAFARTHHGPAVESRKETCGNGCSVSKTGCRCSCW